MFSQKLRQFLYDRNETKRGISNFSCRKTFFTFWNLDIDLMQSWSFNHVYTSNFIAGFRILWLWDSYPIFFWNSQKTSSYLFV